jgi:hypothetical protein
MTWRLQPSLTVGAASTAVLRAPRPSLSHSRCALRSPGIFFDTYGEYYEDMQALHKRLPSLMNDRGVYCAYSTIDSGA